MCYFLIGRSFGNFKEEPWRNPKNPSKVVDEKVNLYLEKGLELGTMWGFFNKQFRRTMEKKISMSVKL